MIIPWGTDAPIYHRPWATMALMAATIGAFVLSLGSGLDQVEPFILSHGDGLHPVQWLTSNFIHADIVHLAGNLIFLWAFALVVEGKVGFWPFLAIYLGLGISQCALEQVLALRMDPGGGSLGASAIIYGIMAMALVWAPRNDLNCVGMFRFNVDTFDLPILWFATFYLAFEVFGVVWAGFAVSSALLHVSGAAIGFVLATAMLRMGWVDCEKWDLYSVWGGHQGRDRPAPRPSVKLPASATANPRGKKAKAKATSSPDDRADAAAVRMRRALEEGDAEAALAGYEKALRARADWRPADAEWLALIQVLATARDWSGSVKVMEDYLRRAIKPSDRVRLRLAQVLIREQQRPAHALGVLAEIPDGSLPADLEATRVRLRAQAEQMREDGVLELDGQAW